MSPYLRTEISMSEGNGRAHRCRRNNRDVQSRPGYNGWTTKFFQITFAARFTRLPPRRARRTSGQTLKNYTGWFPQRSAFGCGYAECDGHRWTPCQWILLGRNALDRTIRGRYLGSIVTESLSQMADFRLLTRNNISGLNRA